MTYQLFDSSGGEVTHADLQNRAVWHRHGVRREDVFVEKYGHALDVKINPAKKRDPTVPDLLHRDHLADLKCQNTPFFHAFKAGIDPTHAVTFNLKDAYHYDLLLGGLDCGQDALERKILHRPALDGNLESGVFQARTLESLQPQSLVQPKGQAIGNPSRNEAKTCRLRAKTGGGRQGLVDLRDGSTRLAVISSTCKVSSGWNNLQIE